MLAKMHGRREQKNSARTDRGGLFNEGGINYAVQFG